MSSRYLLRAIHILLLAIVACTPLFYIPHSVYPYTFSKTLFFQVLVEVLFAVWLAYEMRERRARLRRTPLFTALVVFLGVLFVTSLTGADFWRSFWGTQERVIGIFAFLHFAVLAIVLSSLQGLISWKKLFSVSLVTASAVSFLGFLQLSNPNLLLNESVGTRPGSTFGNPSFLAGYLLFHCFIALYFLFSTWSEGAVASPPRRARISATVFFAVTFFLTAFGLVNTQTRGDLLGVALGGISLAAFFAVRPPHIAIRVLKDRRPYVALLAILIVFSGTFWFTRQNAVWDSVPGLARFRDISLSDQALLPRISALRAAWQGFLDRPLAGWGWENFNLVFNKYYDPHVLSVSYQETRFDKPHNLFFEYLVTGGIPLLGAFLFLCSAFAYEAWCLKDIAFRAVVISTLIAYLVRSVFIFDTLGPLLMLFLFFGVVDGAYRTETNVMAPGVRADGTGSGLARGWLPWFLLGVALIFTYVVNIQSLQASYHQYWGFIDFVRKKPSQAISEFHAALDSWSPYHWAFARDYAAVIAENYFYNPSSVPTDEVFRAVRAVEQVAAEHPDDAYNHYFLVDFYNQISDIDIPRFTAAAEREGERALALSPARQEVLFSLAKTKHIEGDDTGAIALVRQGLDLNPLVPDAHFYYGVLAFAANDPATGYVEIKKAIALGRGWKNYHEPRVVADYFADSGHLDEAIELYKKALSMNSDDAEAKIKLGAAYYFAHQPSLARQYLTEALAAFDITTSPSYQNFKPIFDELGITVPRGAGH